MTTILVLGATGKTGRHLVPALVSRNFGVKAATRNPEAFQATAGVAAVRFDWPTARLGRRPSTASTASI